MAKKYRIKIKEVALAVASAILVISCGDKAAPPRVEDPETTPSMISRDHVIIQSTNGRMEYRLETPLLMDYDFAAQPFMEFPEGGKIETFDSLMVKESDLVADYVHYSKETQLWTLRGNVVGRNLQDERSLFTELLYYDEKQELVYTPEKARVIDGGSYHTGIGFQTNTAFDTWEFKNTVGKFEVPAAKDSTASDPADSTAAEAADPDNPDVITTAPGLPETTALPREEPATVTANVPEVGSSEAARLEREQEQKK